MWTYVVSCCSRTKSAERQHIESLREQLARKQEEVRRLQEQCAMLLKDNETSQPDLAEIDDDDPDPHALWLPGTTGEQEEGAEASAAPAADK